MEPFAMPYPAARAVRASSGGYHPRWRNAQLDGRLATSDRPTAEASALPSTDRSPDDSLDQAQIDKDARRAEEAALLARIVDRDCRVEALYARYGGPLLARVS
jgi:hypothetical protein